MSDCLVLAPGTSVADVEAALGGWSGGTTDLVTGVGDEPVSARAGRVAVVELRYSANPAIGLRVIEGSGIAEVAARLPVLSGERAVLLAGSSVRAEALLGITALGLYGDIDALPTLQRLAASADESLRGAAELAIRRIGMAALINRRHTRARPTPRPSRS